MVIGIVLFKNGREVEVEIFILEMRSLGVDFDVYFFNIFIRGYGSKGFVYLVL